jgi:hypothetical protein
MLELICPEKFPGWYELLIRDLMPLYATGVALIAAGISFWSVRVRNKFEKRSERSKHRLNGNSGKQMLRVKELR